MRWIHPLFGFLLALGISGVEPRAEEVDPYDLLPDSEGPGKDYVFAICTGCHSIRTVVQQGLSRNRWDKLLNWMVKEQGMAELDPETREIVLDYLATYLNEDYRLGAQ